MSLVNDALKRAKEAHDKQAGTAMRGAPLHTAAPPPASKMWLVALLAFVLAIAAAGGGIWYWQKHQPFSTAAAPAQPAFKIIMGTKVEPTVPPPAAPAAVVVDNRRLTMIPPPAASPAPTAPPPPPPVALKLQGILYSATKPAAILNGRTVCVGDRLSGITITAIEPDRITITYSNQPIVIRMP